MGVRVGLNGGPAFKSIGRKLKTCLRDIERDIDLNIVVRCFSITLKLNHCFRYK